RAAAAGSRRRPSSRAPPRRCGPRRGRAGRSRRAARRRPRPAAARAAPMASPGARRSRVDPPPAVLRRLLPLVTPLSSYLTPTPTSAGQPARILAKSLSLSPGAAAALATSGGSRRPAPARWASGPPLDLYRDRGDKVLLPGLTVGRGFGPEAQGPSTGVSSPR